MKDLEKRKRVMGRSMRLGHCICDPKKACPCDVFLERDVCLCAGERLEVPAGPVRLTRLVENAGCASKIDQAALKSVLEGLPSPQDPRVLIGTPAGDDAGVFLMDGGAALVQTVDVFTPSVDDAYLFGQVAAANSVSDVYAMGGRPLTALSVVGFPVRTVSDDLMHEILRGGVDKMTEAGVAVIGGHSINDEQIKAGFAVTGLIDPDRIITNAGAQAGDALVLTKPLGTGIIAFASQIDRARPSDVQAATDSMTALNATAAALMIEFGAHACTDVTGFGLVGHIAEMASSSKVDVEITWDDVPLLPGVLQYVAEGIVPGGVERNRESSAGCVEPGENVQAGMLEVCLDPQTSGGLLIAAEAGKAQELVERLHAAGVADAAIIGSVIGAGSGRISLRTRGSRPIPSAHETSAAPGAVPAGAEATEKCCAGEPERDSACCAGEQGGQAAAPRGGGAEAIRESFQEFLRCAKAPRALDAYTKQVLAIALSVCARCEPCARIHIEKAREMGISQKEIDEAAWMAISFAGSPAMMLYDSVRKE